MAFFVRAFFARAFFASHFEIEMSGTFTRSTFTRRKGDMFENMFLDLIGGSLSRGRKADPNIPRDMTAATRQTLQT